MKYYHSGLNQRGHIELIASEGARGMVNASTAREPAVKDAIRRAADAGCELVLDSGAFQGFTDLDAYAELIDDIGERVEWYANLDVIGDQDASDDNHHALCSRGYDPVWIYQVASERYSYLRTMAYNFDFIGIGGLVPYALSSRDRITDELERLSRTVEGAGVKAHLFGIGSPALLHLLQEPRFDWVVSCDSQKWLVGKRARALLRANGDQIHAANAGLALTGEECARQNVRQIDRWAAGDGAGELFTPHLHPEKAPATPSACPDDIVWE